MRPNLYNPSKIPPDHVIAALVYLLEVLTSNPDEQAAKVRVISDFISRFMRFVHTFVPISPLFPLF